MGAHVACMREMRNAYRIFIGRPKRKRPLGGDVSLDGRIILEWVLGK